MAVPKIKIFPSILAADKGRLAASCRQAADAGADGLHVDIMDGMFVGNICMGLDIVRTVKEAVDLPVSMHLMVMRPDWYVAQCAEYGADTVLFHIEARCEPTEALESIKSAGRRAGLVLNPETPLEAIRPWLPHCDEVLCMSVHPGFGGQSFLPGVLEKIDTLRAWEPGLDISVDGGIDMQTAPRVARAGGNVLLAGTSIFGAHDLARALLAMRTAASDALRERLKKAT